MKHNIRLALLILIALMSAMPILAQDRPSATKSAAETGAELRVQLDEVKTREAALQARANQLDEDLKPENIERSLAGIGSTKPEELREQRRSQLSIERDGVRRQLELLATSRSRLESAILAADSRAYQQSAAETGSQINQARVSSISPGWVAAGAVGFIGLAGIAGLIALKRRRRA